MAHALENCTENIPDIYPAHEPVLAEIKLKAPEPKDEKTDPTIPTASPKIKRYYRLQAEGDSKFYLTAKLAREGGAIAEFTAAGWVYKSQEDAEKVARKWTDGKRKVKVVRRFEPLLDKVWYGSKDEARLAKKQIMLEVDRHKKNKNLQDIEIQCDQAGLPRDWLHEETLPDDYNFSEHDKKTHAHFKPLWNRAKEEQEEIALKDRDIKREEEVLESGNIEVNGKALLDNLQRNEIGDANLFVEKYKNKYVFDQTEGKNGAFYLWNGKHWELDLHKSRYKDFDAISEDYLQASKNERLDKETKEALEKRSHQLRTDRRRRNVLETVSADLSFRGKWDNIPRLLPCKNGIVDLTSGKFLESTPDFYIRKVCPVNYNESAKCPKFQSFLYEISLEDEEWVSFLQRSLGYALIGVPVEEILIYWYGEGGRNGKGTLAKVIQHVLGPLVKSFPAEMLLLQRNLPSSSTPSPELANLEGVRIALFSEINEGRKIDSAKVKNLSGRDTIPCRRLFSNADLQIEPVHTMFLQTNYKPKAPADDNALWNRNVLMPFPASFVRNPKNKNERPLKENLKEELLEEAEGILAWLVQGSLQYKENGLKIPESILQQTENYRKENDGIGCFLEERCVQESGFSASKIKMRNEIQSYCEKNGFKRPGKNEISSYLKNKFSDSHSRIGDFWMGVKILENEELNQ